MAPCRGNPAPGCRSCPHRPAMAARCLTRAGNLGSLSRRILRAGTRIPTLVGRLRGERPADSARARERYRARAGRRESERCWSAPASVSSVGLQSRSRLRYPSEIPNATLRERRRGRPARQQGGTRCVFARSPTLGIDPDLPQRREGVLGHRLTFERHDPRTLCPAGEPPVLGQGVEDRLGHRTAADIGGADEKDLLHAFSRLPEGSADAADYTRSCRVRTLQTRGRDRSRGRWRGATVIRGS